MTDSNATVTLAMFPTELLAQMLASALGEAGITAVVAGGTTGGFRAEAPGMVKVLVAAADIERARAVFKEWEHAGQSIDWDQVDVGKPNDD